MKNMKNKLLKELKYKISIITVCLNSEKTIEQTIQSVIGQNDENFEYIIIDGGSSDKTLEIIDKYKKDIHRIVSEPDSGIYDAMNKGIALATGDIIGIINSDDWYEPEALRMVRECFQKTGAEVVYGRMNVIGENGERRILIPTDIRKIRYEMEVPHPTVFIKKDIYDKYGVFQLNYKIASDYELLLRFYTRGVKFIRLDKILANFRSGGISQSEERLCALETVTVSEKYIHCIPPEEKGYYENIILYRRRVVNFLEILDSHLFNISEFLERKLGKGSKNDIAIFGAGEWGIKIYYELKHHRIAPVFFVDNNEEKWDTEKYDVKILRPQVLKDFKGVLLIVVKDFSGEILSQISGIHNPEISCITWEEIADALTSV